MFFDVFSYDFMIFMIFKGFGNQSCTAALQDQATDPLKIKRNLYKTGKTGEKHAETFFPLATLFISS